jgi:hypothetical protein
MKPFDFTNDANGKTNTTERNTATFFSSIVADLALRLGPDGERSGKSCTKR